MLYEASPRREDEKLATVLVIDPIEPSRTADAGSVDGSTAIDRGCGTEIEIKEDGDACSVFEAQPARADDQIVRRSA